MRQLVHVSSAAVYGYTLCSTLTVRFGDCGCVHVLVEGHYLTAADGKDVREVALDGALVGFDLPDVMTEHDDLVALCMNSRSSNERASCKLARVEKNSPTAPRPCRLPAKGTFSISGSCHVTSSDRDCNSVGMSPALKLA